MKAVTARVLFIVLTCFTYGPVLGQELAIPADIESQAAGLEVESEMVVPKVVKGPILKSKATLRLPRYFASIVDDDQRRAILEIQRGYQSQVQLLEEQLLALKRAELSEVEGVLSQSQRAELEAMRNAKSAGVPLQGEKPVEQKAGEVKAGKVKAGKEVAGLIEGAAISMQPRKKSGSLEAKKSKAANQAKPRND